MDDGRFGEVKARRINAGLSMTRLIWTVMRLCGTQLCVCYLVRPLVVVWGSTGILLLSLVEVYAHRH